MTAFARRIDEELGYWSKVQREALRAFIAELPDPQALVVALPPSARDALARCHRVNRLLVASDETDARILRRWSLCDCGTNCRSMTVLGVRTWRALMGVDR